MSVTYLFFTHKLKYFFQLKDVNIKALYLRHLRLEFESPNFEFAQELHGDCLLRDDIPKLKNTNINMLESLAATCIIT